MESQVAQIIHVNGIENLLLHFVFQIPKENPGFSCLDYSLQKPSNPLESMGQLLEWDIIEQPALTDDDLYPINLMRNVARMMLPKYALATVVDAHFRFSTDFVRNSLLAIETAQTPLTSIFIYPSLEGLMDAALLLPLTKPELKAGFDQGSVQPFMTLLNTQAHRLKEPDAWLANTDVGFQQAGYTHQAYQPQFISLNTLYLNAIRTARREQLHKANVENAEVLEEARAKRQLRIPNGTLQEPEQKPPAQRLPEVIEEQPGQLGT
ncbi:unnamed protein product, partial [Mesorhabditis spiculigera]